MSTKPLLIEIGVEEIPAGVSKQLYNALCQEIGSLLAANDISPNKPDIDDAFTPRRLLYHQKACPTQQPDRDETVWGPPESVAYKDGKPTQAAEGFARKSGLSVSDFALEDKGDGKGRYLKAVVHRQGRAVADIIAEAMPGILRKLPSPKRMKWNDGDARDDAFIRPIRWIVARLGDDVIPFSFAGVESGKLSRGHRIHGGEGELDINDPLGWLRGQKVELIKSERMKCIVEGMSNRVVPDPGLIIEVADLTEWPVPIPCEFDQDFLRLPEEVIRITLKSHQRCFITHSANGKLSNKFFAVANLESKEPEKVALGNARVVNARLSDAAFYFERDPKESLEARVVRLNDVVFQDGLGMVGDQVARLRVLAPRIAGSMGGDKGVAARAAYLCKSDLTTGLVGEFPELQGYMGGEYAKMQGEPDAVADAIAWHYQGVKTIEAKAIAIAENIDKLLGYFQIGKVPTASADPYALRRAAIRLVEMLTKELQEMTSLPSVVMPLRELIRLSAAQWNEQRITVSITKETEQVVYDFIIERLLNAYDQHPFYSKPAIEAALHSTTERPLCDVMDIARLLANFAGSEAGQAAAAANKRIVNILKKTEIPAETSVNESLLSENAEKALLDAMKAFDEKTCFLVRTNGELDPEEYLALLAGLRDPVDRFFDDVMVMCDDAAVRNNRLSLLSRLRGLFLNLADISRL